MNLREVLQYFPASPVISIAGAGGKTTLMFSLADLLTGPCVLTTTTKVGAGQIRTADLCLTVDEFPPESFAKKMWVSPSLLPVNGKIIGCGPEDLEKLRVVSQKFGFPLICEADGAACRHIKAPAAHEPVIIPGTNVFFYVIGLDVLGKPLNAENVHRPELFAEITKFPADAPITKEAMLALLGSGNGGLKNVPDDGLKIVYLTHADTPERIAAAEFISAEQKWYDYMCINR